MVKLLLRKPATWYRLDNLKYENELGGPDAIIAAIDEICEARPDTPDAIQDLKEECEVVDLTRDEETSQSTEAISGHNLMVSDNSGDSNTLDTATCRKLDALAENENEMDLEDLLDCLKTDELKSIAKQFQLKLNGKVRDSSKSSMNFCHFLHSEKGAHCCYVACCFFTINSRIFGNRETTVRMDLYNLYTDNTSLCKRTKNEISAGETERGSP